MLAFGFTFTVINADSTECPTLVIFTDTTPMFSHTSYSACSISIRDHRSSSLWERKECECRAKLPGQPPPAPAAQRLCEEPSLPTADLANTQTESLSPNQHTCVILLIRKRQYSRPALIYPKPFLSLVSQPEGFCSNFEKSGLSKTTIGQDNLSLFILVPFNFAVLLYSHPPVFSQQYPHSHPSAFIYRLTPPVGYRVCSRTFLPLCKGFLSSLTLVLCIIRSSAFPLSDSRCLIH